MSAQQPARALASLLTLAALALLTAQAVFAQADTSALDPRLSTYPYPYPVDFLALESQGQSLELAYMDVAPSGTPNGRTALLLHGKNFNGAYWATTIDTLRAAGFRVVVPDQVGFGKSSKPERFQFTFQQLAEHTRTLLDTLGVGSAVVLGHSMGGMLATRFALMYPERSAALVLVNPIGLEDWKRVVPYRTVDAWYAGALTSDYASIKAYQTENYYHGEWRAAYEPYARLLARWARHPDYARVAWDAALTYDMIYTQPVVYEFGLVDVPTLLIIGTLDRTALGKDRVDAAARDTLGRYDRLGRATAAAIPDASLVELAGVGHLPQLEAFDRYAAALLSWLTPTLGEPERVAAFDRMQVTGVTVSEAGRVFVTFPRWRAGVPYTLAEVDTATGEARPYPSAAANDWDVGQAAGEAFVSVQSAIAIGDTLLVADTRNPLFGGLLDQPRLHLYRLSDGALLRTYVIDSAATDSATYLNDLRVDRRRGIVYFTDSGAGALVALDLATGASRRLLAGHPSTAAEVDHLTIRGERWANETNADGIALDAAADRLYYHALTGYTLYALPLAVLAQADTSGLAAAVQTVARTPAPDGMWVDARGRVLMADLEGQRIVAVDPATGRTETLVGDAARVGWADTFSVHDGWLYYTDSRLDEVQVGQPVAGMSFPLWRVRLGG